MNATLRFQRSIYEPERPLQCGRADAGTIFRTPCACSLGALTLRWLAWPCWSATPRQRCGFCPTLLASRILYAGEDLSPWWHAMCRSNTRVQLLLLARRASRSRRDRRAPLVTRALCMQQDLQHRRLLSTWVWLHRWMLVNSPAATMCHRVPRGWAKERGTVPGRQRRPCGRHVPLRKNMFRLLVVASFGITAGEAQQSRGV